MSRTIKVGSYHPQTTPGRPGSAEVWVPDTHPELVVNSRLKITPKAVSADPVEVEVTKANRIPGTGWWNIEFVVVP